MLLNLRSKSTNLHQRYLSVTLWNGGIQRRQMQTLNQVGATSSYPSTLIVVKGIAIDEIRRGRAAACDGAKVKVI